MKIKSYAKIIAIILTLSLLLGYMTVLTSVAASTESNVQTAANDPTDEDVLQVLLNRDFEDNKYPQNGGTLSSSSAANAISVEKSDGNTYLRFTQQGAHDYIYYSLGSYVPESGSVVMKMDIMVENTGISAQGMIQLNPRVRGSSSDIYRLINIKTYSSKSHLMPFDNSPSALSKYTMESGEWYTVTIVWSYASKESVTCTIFNEAGAKKTYTDTTAAGASGCTDVRPGDVRVGTTASATGSWCLDNVVIYTTSNQNASQAAEYYISPNDKGAMFNANGATYVDQELFNGSAYMKVDVERALGADGKTVELSDAPFVSGDVTFVPTSALSALGITVTTATQRIDGVECVAVNDINKATGGLYYSAYSSMGLIGISSSAISFDGLTLELLPIMQKFIFDGITSDLKNANAYSVSDMTSLQHPYIYANQTEFDALASVYASRSDATLASYLDYQAAQAANVYKNYATTSGNTYKGIKSGVDVIPYISGYGYDVGGRLNEAAQHTSRIQTLAFGYQITKNENYARLAYDYAIALGQWEHWGPGHFLNCADAASPYAIAYDWLYSVWCELGLDVKAIEEILFTHAILPAYYSAHDNGCPWYDPVVSSGWNFHTRDNNWNAVCSAGVTVAALALVGETTSAAGTMLDITIDGVYNPDTPSYAGTTGTITRKDGKSFKTDQSDMQTYRDYCEYLVNLCLYCLPMYGMEQYAPDGSYIESNGYWSYGTNNFFEMTAALTSTTGNDYGLLDTWGIDRTAYFALNTQSGDYKGWNYHDSDSVGAQDTSWFIYLGTEDGLNDKALAGIRKRILATATNLNPSMFDAIYYMSDEEIGTFELPDIQYYMEGIDGYVIRDSWDAESIYAGIMGNTNNLGHGQIDSGSFVYHNGGTIWFCDVGTENYNSYGFWSGGTRYTYYKMNAEGNNALIMTSKQSAIPYGQSLNGFGYMTEVYDNEYGAYAIIDNTSVYSGYATSAYRGMLFTNDRKTLVIQDEVVFKKAESVVWIGHTEQEVVLSVDGKTAYMYDGKNVLKVTLIDKTNLGLKFELTDTYDFLLDCTVGPNYSTDHGGVAEDDRSTYKRLIIRAENVTSLALAVVIEEVAIGVSTNELGYEWCPMSDWVPTADGRAVNSTLAEIELEDGDVGTTVTDGKITLSSAITGGNAAAQIVGSAGTASFVTAASKTEYGTLGGGALAIELDVKPGGEYDGTSLCVTSNGGTLVNVNLSSLGEAGKSDWIRCTIIIDLKTNTALIFSDDEMVASSSYASASLENLALTVKAANEDNINIIIDNVIIRYFVEEYDGLSAIFNDASLDSWSDRTEARRTLSGTKAVATVTSGSVSKTAYSFAELATLITEGCTIELHENNYEKKITVNVPCTVVTGGYTTGMTSDKYVAKVSGDRITYESGKITVSWVIGNNVYNEDYTASKPATYKGIQDSTIYEQDNGNGTYSYYTLSGWSKTNGGKALTEDEMTVTADNCVFYAVKTLYTGAFVAVSGNSVLGYTDSTALFKSYVLNAGYERISLTSDIVYDSTGISDSNGINSVFNLYLNGYSITYTSSDTSDHMLTVGSSSGRLNVYGPGEIISNATQSNIIYQSSGNVYAEGVTFTTYRPVTDARYGLGHYKNCTVTITSNAQAFGALNRNNAVTDEGVMPYLLIDGCTISIPKSNASTAAFTVQSNATIELNGGTVINMGGTGGYLFNLINSSVSSSSYDYTNGYTYMRALIGDVYHDCESIYKNTTNASGKTFDMGGKVSYCEGARFTEMPDGVKLSNDCIIARQSDMAYPYVVASVSSCAEVTFTLGDKSVTEYWLDGEIPDTKSEAVINMLNKNPAESGKRYYFESDAVKAGSKYTLEARQISSFTIMASMTMHTGFDFNVYVPVSVDGAELVGFYLDGVYTAVADAATSEIDGATYYKISALSLAPHNAARSMPLDIVISSEGAQMHLTSTVSVLDYAKEIFDDSSYTGEVRMLIANILKYVETSYVYAENTDAPEYQALKLLYDTYKSYSTVSVVQRNDANMSAVADGVKSASLILSNDPTYHFIFNESYTGNITFKYYEGDREQTLSVDVVNGRYNGKSYVNISRDPYELTDGVLITTAGGSATYDLSIYYHHTATELGMVTNIMNALYAYCECAKIYCESEYVK